MRSHTKLITGLSLFVSIFAGTAITPGASAQEAQQPQRDANGMPSIPPAGPGRIGPRVERLRLTLPVDPAVVVVPDGDAYIDAIAHWSTEHRYPVLIDDGTPGARENIARFVRAFKPGQVLRWHGVGEHKGGRRERIESAFEQAWGADSNEQLREVWTEMGLQPPGVVVTAKHDPAWTAALALAAGRGQPIFWVDGGYGKIGGVNKFKAFERLSKQVQDQFQGLGYTWAKIGDDIEAITVCMNMPSRVSSRDNMKEILALTDLLGRFDDGRIYAWTGIIVGTEAEAAYRAMGALFLQPEKYWLFNGYGTEPPFDGYTITTIEGALRRMNLPVQAYGPPRNSVNEWRAATRKPIEAGYIHVNTAGNRDFFKLNPGRAYASDIPFLDTPAVVTFIHSFSAQKLSDRDSIARRWLDNGVYAYAGAVDEPFLQSFTPPAYLLPGLNTPTPLGMISRSNSSRPWKINTIGDPLITFGPRAKRTDHIPDLPGAVNMATTLKTDLSSKQYANGLRQLVMLGRIEDASQLGMAIITQDRQALTPEVAEVLLPVFYRTGQPDMLTTCYLAMDSKDRSDTLVVDMVWKALGNELARTRNEQALAVCSANIRDASFNEDVMKVSRATRRLSGDGAAMAFLTRLSRTDGLSKKQRRFLADQIDRVNPRRNNRRD